jgi:endonuclease YncB( thermonuclease family)
MKTRSLFLALALIVLSAMSAVGQARFAGKVVEVVDGKTVFVDTNTGRIKAELQYVEIPEPEQPMHAAVKEHLAKIALGRIVEFKPVRIGEGLTVGRVTIGSVDLSMQMIRDGAAWHEPSGKSGQPQSAALEYDKNQALARSEKRGVWSIPNLKAPWQVRAEKEEKLRRQEETANLNRPAVVGVTEFQSATRPVSGTVARPALKNERWELDAWADVFAGVGRESAGLQTYSDPQQRFATIYTPLAFVNIASGSNRQKIEFRAMYIKVNFPNGTSEVVYLIGFQSLSEDVKFSKRVSRLTITADKQPLNLGTPYSMNGSASFGVRELLFYKASKTTLKKIGNAKNVNIQIEGYSGPLSDDARENIKQLITTVE